MKNKSTVSVHAGHRAGNLGVVNPIEPSSAFQYIDSGDQFYPRYFNTPNQQIIIEKIAALENAPTGLIFSSGMAAISTTLRSLLKPGDHLVMLENLYGGTLAFAARELPELGIEYTVAAADVDALMAGVQDDTRVILVETPANPLMQIVDLQQLADRARKKGITTVVDNTFASPINQNPYQLGMDLVIHSGTKYLGGHSDLSFGAVVGSAEKVESIRQKAIHYGANLNALTCYLIERSIKTLDVRVQRQNLNAQRMAEYLSEHPAVDRVYYPGLPGHPGHPVAAVQMHGFGGMLAFDLGGRHAPEDFLRQLKLIVPAMSLGGVESTAIMPVHASHKLVPADERRRLGIGDRLIRISAGIEGTDDLLEDLRHALQSHVRRDAMVAAN